MGGVELLQDLIHDRVCQIGDHGQLHLPAREEMTVQSACSPESCMIGSFESAGVSYSRAWLMSSAARSIRALRMAEQGMETCSEMAERGGLSLSAAEQDMGHNSRQRDTMESTTTWTSHIATGTKDCSKSYCWFI